MFVRRAAAQIAVAAVIPTALFSLVASQLGLRPAIAVAVVYAYGLAGWQRRRHGRASGLVSLTCVLATARAAVALAVNSGHFYFGLPVIETALVGVTFMATCWTSSPLVKRIASDLVPGVELDDRVIVRLSAVWMVVHLGIASTTLWLLTHEPISVFVWMKVVNGWTWMGAGALASLVVMRAHIPARPRILPAVRVNYG